MDFQRAKLSIPELKSLAANAGFEGDDIDKAVAIALAESGGDPRAYNPETAAGTVPGRGSYGLWQIYQTAHPEYDSATLFDPQGNANAAYAIFSQSGGFTPWSTYNSLAYLNFLGDVQNG
jgi:hypothetical protein